MSGQKKLEQLALKIMTHWGTIHPMATWVSPESAVDSIVAELLTLRAENAKLQQELDAAPYSYMIA